MRVAHLTSVHRSDDNRIYYKECASLASSGLQVTLVSTGDGRNVRAPGVSDHWIPKRRGRLARLTVSSYDVLQAAGQINADLYHIHDPELLVVGVALVRKGHKVVYDAHEDVPDSVAYKNYLPRVVRSPLASLVDRAELRLASRMSGLVAATPHIAERLSQAGPPVETVQNFPRTEELGSTPKSVSIRGLFSIAYVGAISVARGARNMIAALEHLGGEYEFVLAGSFEADDLRSDLLRSPSWRFVRETGFASREMVAQILSEADVGLVLFEPERNYLLCYPTKMFEYMAAGIPVIASDFPLWRSIVEEAECGMLVNPSDPAAVAAALEWLRAHPDEARAMGSRGREAVLSRMNWGAEADKLLAFYSRIMSASETTPK